VDLLLPLAAILAAGGFAGFMSGLLGIGGGFVVVPALFLMAEPLGVDPEMAMHMAVGTSLAAMIVTTARSARGHDLRGFVDRALLLRLLPAILIGAIGGALFASSLKGPTLTAIFAGAAFMLSIRTYLGREATGGPVHPMALALQYGAAGAVGFASAVVGIGGAAFGAPLFTRLGLGFHKVVGTAAGVGVLIAIPAAIIYALSGLDQPGRPPLSIGYVNIPGCVLILISTALTTRFGLRLNTKLTATQLRQIFAAFLMATAMRMAWSLAS
jgi:uncharacterized membrane protein YfcA